MSKSHSGNIETSQRLQKAYRAIADGEWRTTTELSRLLDTGAVAATMQDLRLNGYEVDCQYVGRSESGARVYRYRLIPEKGQIELGISGIRKVSHG